MAMSLFSKKQTPPAEEAEVRVNTVSEEPEAVSEEQINEVM